MKETLWMLEMIFMPLATTVLMWFCYQVIKLKHDFVKFQAEFMAKLEGNKALTDQTTKNIRLNCTAYHARIEKQQKNIQRIGNNVLKLCVKLEVPGADEMEVME